MKKNFYKSNTKIKNRGLAFINTYFRGIPFLPTIRNISNIEDEMQRFFEESSLLPAGFYNGVDFVPQCELKETKNEFVACLDIPGVNKDEIKIEVDGNRLSVRGERKSNKEEKDDHCYFCESYHGSFLRTFTLPTKIDEGKVDAKYEKGVLTIRVPKTETPKAKQIAVH